MITLVLGNINFFYSSLWFTCNLCVLLYLQGAITMLINYYGH